MVRQSRVKRGEGPLEAWEFWPFIEKLSAVNKQSALIARLLWKLNRVLACSGAYVTLGEILLLRKCDVRMDKKMLDLFRITRNRHVWIAIELPDYIFGPLVRMIKPDSPFVFSNRDGKQLSHKQVAGHFLDAGKRANIKRVKEGNAFKVTPLLLRPVYKPLSKVAHVYKQRCAKQPYSITEEQLDVLLADLSKSCRGAKSKCGHKAILRAIVYRLQTKCRWSKLPQGSPGSPPWKVVESQFRRWKKSGFIEKVQDYLVKHAPNPGC